MCDEEGIKYKNKRLIGTSEREGDEFKEKTCQTKRITETRYSG